MKRNPGANTDTRSSRQKAKDFKFEEIVASADTVKWVEKKPSQWRQFSIRDQDGSSSCVKQSIAKLAEIQYFLKTGEKVPFSAGFYKYRSNYPSEGMIGVDAFDIWRKKGITLESVLPSQQLSEKQLNEINDTPSAKDTAIVFKIDGFVQFTPGEDFETVASTIQKTGKGVMVWFRFKYSEWKDVPEILSKAPDLHHSVVAVDFTLYKGKKYLIIEDSWGVFGLWKGRRLISEEFFKARNTFAAYPRSFSFSEGSSKKPSYDGTIISLQKCLQHEGLFPLNVDFVENYGPITKRSVIAFQKKHSISPAIGNVGPITIAKLKSLYP